MKERAIPRIITTVQITPEFYDLCKTHNIKFSEALRVGISMLLAEKDVQPYDNNLNLYRKMIVYKEELERVLNKVNEELQVKGGAE